jgi:light-regulated signal transduction histidine kinase (bacteriophytochrome)
LRTALEALRATADDGIAGSSSLTSIDPAAEAFAADVSGVLYVSLSPNHGRCLLFLRPEQRATVTWAGDPNKAIVAEPGRTRLSPRGSFAAWEQITHGDSTRWTERDLRAAGARANLSARALRRPHQVARPKAAC